MLHLLVPGIADQSSAITVVVDAQVGELKFPPSHQLGSAPLGSAPLNELDAPIHPTFRLLWQWYPLEIQLSRTIAISSMILYLRPGMPPTMCSARCESDARGKAAKPRAPMAHRVQISMQHQNEGLVGAAI
jgi:hypothetical protein